MYIDGYIARIQRPDGAGDAYFCGRHGKSCDSLNTQYISDQHGLVRHIITGSFREYETENLIIVSLFGIDLS